jgi:hypothetical protein
MVYVICLLCNRDRLGMQIHNIFQKRHEEGHYQNVKLMHLSGSCCLDFKSARPVIVLCLCDYQNVMIMHLSGSCCLDFKSVRHVIIISVVLFLNSLLCKYRFCLKLNFSDMTVHLHTIVHTHLHTRFHMPGSSDLSSYLHQMKS